MTGLVLAVLLAFAEPPSWPGVDKTVVERFAKEAGRAPRRPLLDTDRGDLLLFVFLVAGIAGGFTLGYTYRVMFVEGRGSR